MPSFSYATASFSSPVVPAPLCRTFQVSHVFSEDAVRRDHGLSLADLARGRLRLDRLSRNVVGKTFFPWARAHSSRKQESLSAVILRFRSGPRAGASSIVPGSSIAIEAAVVAGLRNSKEK